MKTPAIPLRTKLKLINLENFTNHQIKNFIECLSNDSQCYTSPHLTYWFT